MVASNTCSGVGEYSLFHGGSVISKHLLGQARSSEFGWRCVSSNGVFTSFLLGTRANNIFCKYVTVQDMKCRDIKIPIIK